jgi:uncharacterized protein (DUF1499 family)
MTVWWSKAILIGGVIAAVCLPLGALGTKFGIWPFTGGFMLLAAGTVLAILAVALGIIALVIASRRGLAGDKPGIYLGMLVGALVLGLMGTQYMAATKVPPIHNISTDTIDPPQFDKVVALRGEANPLAYDAEKLAGPQQEAYPWVKTLTLSVPPAQALTAARGALEAMGLEVVNEDAAAGLVEATDTTFWFGFKDDVVVRIRAAGAGSIVDARSVSRVGVSDVGANARRIGELLEHLSGS